MPEKIEAAPEELVAGDGLHAGRVTAREHELGEQGAVNKILIWKRIGGGSAAFAAMRNHQAAATDNQPKEKHTAALSTKTITLWILAKWERRTEQQHNQETKRFFQ
jgi:hypothetical protein